jgi:SOS-response transcriptional repressor LexA
MIKAGVIGLGSHFLEHILGSIRETCEIKTTIICDIDTKKIDRAKLYFPDASTTTDWQEVFKADVDIVICGSYPQLHEGIIEWGIKYNKPVFVEKPPFVSGEATKFADGRIVDNLSVSPSILSVKFADDMYALIARGDSMNHATVAGKEIENDDYIIVQKKSSYEPNTGDIVVSDIGGLANVKRFKRDQGRIILVSDSYRQQDFAPIVISEHDDYNILGEVVDVVKAVA